MKLWLVWKLTLQIGPSYHDLRDFTPQDKKQNSKTADILRPLCALVSLMVLAPSDVRAWRACLGGRQELSKDGLVSA